MKKSDCLLFILFFSLAIMAQNNINLSDEFYAVEKERASYWKTG